MKTTVREKAKVMIMLATMLRESDENNGVLVPERQVAIKVTDRTYLQKDRELIENPLDEIAAMFLLSKPGHDNVLEMLDFMMDDEYLYAVLPFLPGKDLYHRMKSRGGKPLDEATARKYFKQIVNGLLYMKSKGFCHRDLSLENIMFDMKNQAKIIDLGMCLKVPSGPEGRRVLISSQSKRGKASYVCPEIAREEIFDGYAADVWSLGIILYIMLTVTPLYASPDDQAFGMIVNGDLDMLLDHYESLGLKVSPLVRDLVSGMLHLDVNSRLTLEELARHPWVTGEDRCTAAGKLNVL